MVSCTSADNCWAVGHDTTKLGNLNQVLHWTGKKWFHVAVPTPAGTGRGDNNELFAVRCTLASDCWAVGDSERSHSVDLDVALHWNGQKWRQVDTPAPGGRRSGDFNDLDDVSCTSAASCWAVGVYGVDSVTGPSFEIGHSQVLHWNGTKWVVVPAPSPAGTAKNHSSSLDSVRCTAPADCWAAGAFGEFGKDFTMRNEMLHWNGKKWAKVIVPDPAGTTTGVVNELLGLSYTASANCWAAGFYANLDGGPTAPAGFDQLLHWNGRKWRLVSAPNPAGTGAGALSELHGVTCSAASNCWAVGQASNVGGERVTLNASLHWNGVKWSVVSTPSPAGSGNGDVSILNSVRCTAAANCWAVGLEEPDGQSQGNETLHWTGKKWFVR